MPTDTTDLIIFDLGRVLIDFDFRRVIHGLRKHTPLSAKEIHRFFLTTPMWDAFERGRIPPEKFFKELSKDLRLKDMSFSQFSHLWNHIFVEKHDTVALLRRLRGRYRIALLSNVNEMHWMHVRERYDFLEWFDHPVASYAVGLRKPEAKIYQHTLRLAGVPAQRAVFIDDVESHVHAARALGIRAHQFIDARQLQKDLEDLF